MHLVLFPNKPSLQCMIAFSSEETQKVGGSQGYDASISTLDHTLE